jgi:hypothetical protein
MRSMIRSSPSRYCAAQGEDWTMTYRAPVNEMLFMMRHVGDLERAIDEGIYPDLSLDVVENILQEAARFSGEVLAPINRSGDRHGAQLRDGVVTTARGSFGRGHRCSFHILTMSISLDKRCFCR